MEEEGGKKERSIPERADSVVPPRRWARCKFNRRYRRDVRERKTPLCIKKSHTPPA